MSSPSAPGTVVVALSGGVDSATAAALLVEAGHRVVGLTLRLYDASATSAAVGRCCGPRDLEDARATCAHLGIPFYVVDHERAFREHVMDDFVDEYLAGRTPNPCVRCNEHVKFGPLLSRATALGADTLATGHYARLLRGDDDVVRIARARDARKDQSYFLFAMPERDRARVRFPLGDLTKDEVRAHARRLGLPNADKAESQEVCFIPDGDTAGFVARTAGTRAPGGGEIVTSDGRVLGHHEGVHHFTVGQRRGLGQSFGQAPTYVVSVDALRRRVTVGDKRDLDTSSVAVADVRWTGAPPPGALRAEVQLRHRHRPVAALVEPVAGGAARVTFDVPERAPAPGQAAVFYQGDAVVGGGWIASAQVAS